MKYLILELETCRLYRMHIQILYTEILARNMHASEYCACMYEYGLKGDGLYRSLHLSLTLY